MPNESIGVKSSGKIRKIVVDRSACIGARSCALVAGKTFQIDEENLAFVTRDPGQYEDDNTIMKAAEACPVLCIYLYDETGKKLFPAA